MSLRDIIADKTSGSTTILNNSIQWLRSSLEKEHKPEIRQLKSDIIRLFKAHPNFAVLFHFINHFFLALQKSGEEGLLNFVTDYSKKWNESLAGACRNLLLKEDFRSKKILVHSNSTAIYELLKMAVTRAAPAEIYQTLSGPENEGRVQAAALGEQGLKVNLIHENTAGKFIENIDFAVFGADVITEHFFINKTGTFPLALLFNYYHKPVYVIADSRKMLHVSSLPEPVKRMILDESAKPTRELWSDPPANVKPVNYWFERTPLELITGLATNQGFLRPDEVASLVKSSTISDLLVDELMR